VQHRRRAKQHSTGCSFQHFLDIHRSTAREESQPSSGPGQIVLASLHRGPNIAFQVRHVVLCHGECILCRFLRVRADHVIQIVVDVVLDVI